MLRLILTGVVVIITASHVAAQGEMPFEGPLSDEEVASLRSALNVPAATPITAAGLEAVPAGGPLKVYVGAVQGERVRKEVVAWLGKWNKGSAAKYGSLEAVADIADADLILLRHVSQTKITINGREVTADSPIRTPMHPDGIAPPEMAYVYVLARGDDGLGVLWRGTTLTGAGLYKDASRTLEKVLQSLMKERSKAQKR